MEHNQYLDVIFTRNHQPFSILIRLIDMGQWSHCAMIDGDMIVESAFSRGGVKPDTLENLKKRSSAWYICKIPVADRKKAVDAIRSQIGTKYDFTALYGIFISDRNYQEPDAWFCSELIVYGLAMGGTEYFDPSMVHAVTPKMLFSIKHEYVTDSKQQKLSV